LQIAGNFGVAIPSRPLTFLKVLGEERAKEIKEGQGGGREPKSARVEGNWKSGTPSPLYLGLLPKETLT
jgi:hypothetical protein